jgi:hypothetical protein
MIDPIISRAIRTGCDAGPRNSSVARLLARAIRARLSEKHRQDWPPPRIIRELVAHYSTRSTDEGPAISGLAPR